MHQVILRSRDLLARYGVATITPHPADAVTDLFKTADRNLYQAKDSGRNRVVCPIPTQWSPAALT